jgi:hypothetical protein
MIVYHHRVEPHRMIMRCLRFVPHRLLPQQKRVRFQKAQEFLIVLRSAKCNVRSNVITLDESFVDVKAGDEQRGLPIGKALETCEPHMIGSEN